MKIKYKIYLFAVISCVLLAAGLIGCSKQEIKNIGSKGKNILCLGDSLTIGYGAEQAGDYPAALAKMMNTPVINAGVDGDTSSGALRRIDADVLDNDPLLVIIEFGGNDFLRKYPLKETMGNIEKMIDKVQAKGAMVALADIHFSVVMSQYGEELRRLAKKKGAIFIPNLLSGILTNSQLKSDFIHPNAKGYALIAQRVYRVILPHLNRNRLINGFPAASNERGHYISLLPE